MSSFAEKMKSYKTQFEHTYENTDFCMREYIPEFYRRFSKQLERNDIKLSQEAIKDLTTKSEICYIGMVNWAHRTMHDMNSHDENDINPRDKRYHELQYAESLNWLMIKIADDIIDDPNNKGRISAQEVREFIADSLYKGNKPVIKDNVNQAQLEALHAVALCLGQQIEELGATEQYKSVLADAYKAWEAESVCKTMEEYRMAKKTVSEKSSDLLMFFIKGAGDKEYFDRYFRDHQRMDNISKAIVIAANYYDSFKDFNEDRKSTIAHISPNMGDRIWFLSAALKEMLSATSDINSRQAVHMSAVFIRPVVSLAQRIASDKEALFRKSNFEAWIQNAQNILNGNEKQVS